MGQERSERQAAGEQMGEGRKRIGVIGAGMLGVASASFLQREGHDVIPFEPGARASSRAAAPRAALGERRHPPNARSKGLCYMQVTHVPTFACASACEIEST